MFVCEFDPTVTRDSPGQRRKDGDRRWSRYERPLDAVDLTEYAGSRVRESACWAAIMSWVPAWCPDRGCGEAGGHNSAMSSLCRRRNDGELDITAEFAHRCDGNV